VGDAARARLVSALGAQARRGDARALADVIERFTDAAPRVRRACATALGKLGASGAVVAPESAAAARAALIARWDAGDVTVDERRALADALGKLGGAAALERLRALAPGADPELDRRRDRALLIADRTARRAEDSAILTEIPPPTPLRVALGCRTGLAPLLAEELAAIGLAPTRRGDTLEIWLTGPWSQLYAARLWATAQIAIPLVGAVPDAPELATAARRRRASQRETRVSDPAALAHSIVAALTASPVRALLRAWTRGPIRWRLGFTHGHKRALVWRVAQAAAAAAPELINDPSATTWELLVELDDSLGAARRLSLVPRRVEDPRFRWRVVELPAASHPTVAAALVWLGGVASTDRVWDPFCGAGTELIERALRGPSRSLLGTDLDRAALDLAERNLTAAGVTASLTHADARHHRPGQVDLILTNPPLGSRVQIDAAALLESALPHFARALAPAGRLVWITPAPRRTGPVATRLGLRCTRSLAIDLGGVRGSLERWDAAGRPTEERPGR
jgi:precorrin-6B methylase 2